MSASGNSKLRTAMRALVLTCALAASAPVRPQAWLGQFAGSLAARERAAEREQDCMLGKVPSPKEVDEARAPATLAMRSYWSAVSPGGERNVAAVFDGDGGANWNDGSATVTKAEVMLVSDRFSVLGAKVEEEPGFLMRSGDGASARALFRVNGTDGSQLGVYDVTLRRKLGRWRLQRIALLSAATAPKSIAQFCHIEGDVGPYRLQYADDGPVRADKMTRKERLKANKQVVH